MQGKENPIDGQYEFRLEPGVTISGDRQKVERVVCEIALHRRWKAKVEASLDMLDEQPRPVAYAERTFLWCFWGFVACLVFALFLQGC